MSRNGQKTNYNIYWFTQELHKIHDSSQLWSFKNSTIFRLRDLLANKCTIFDNCSIEFIENRQFLLKYFIFYLRIKIILWCLIKNLLRMIWDRGFYIYNFRFLYSQNIIMNPFNKMLHIGLHKSKTKMSFLWWKGLQFIDNRVNLPVRRPF
jgi:hypothetical protein